MKHYRMMILAVLLAIAGRTLADNLTVEAITVSAGETKEVAIVLNNPTHKYAAFQFDLVLSEGISIAKNAKGKLIVSLDEDRKDDHTLNVSEMGSNTYRFLSFSLTNTEFYGSDGAIVHLTLQADGNIGAGKKTAVIQSQVFTKTDGEQTKWNDKTFSLEIEGGDTPVVPDPPVVGDDFLTVEQVGMSAGETKEVAIALNNPTHKYAAFQFDLVLPEGISVAKNAKGKLVASLNEDRKDDHTLNVSEMGSNTYRFLSFSLTNTEFYGTDGAIVYVTLQADGNIGEGEKTATIQSQVFTEVSGEQYKWADKTFAIQIQPAIVPEITADDKTRVYGEDNPVLTYQTSSTVTGTPMLTTTATKNSPVGVYDIVVGKGSVEGNYMAKNGKLTVTKAPLTISCGTYTKKQGEPLPTFKVEYAGFKNGETDAVLTKLPTVSCEASAESEPGEYAITVSGAEAGNYDMSYVAGKLVVTERPSYTLIYFVDGELYKSFTIKEGASITSEAIPTKEGYTFSGWSEIPETMPAKEVTVSGSFTINSYKLTYMIDNKVYKETTFEYGATITAEAQPEGDYLAFEWVDLPKTMPANDVVVYASYTSGIVEALMAAQGNVRIYSPNGKKRDKLQKGLNIVVFDDGTVHKVVK